MKKGARLLFISFLLWFLPRVGMGQITCIYGENISNFSTDQWCSPVQVVYWNISYTEVDNGGAPVSIRYDWGDGSIETKPATEGPAGTFSANANHLYVSNNNICKYYATASMVIGGQICENSAVEKNVPVWDVDNKNGAYVNASPNVYPVCIGNGATMRFDDDTKYNCVPSQEDDIRNESTRWIQWVYGTNNSMSSATPVSINLGGGLTYSGPWPYTTPVKTLPGPSWGSSEQSLPITVADDNQLDEEFQVELRYWNYCNKYTDGKSPVIDRSVIRIVDLPDATIDPVDTLCEFNSSVFLTAATGGGTWTGNGITDGATGEFSPYVAGPGAHIISYEVTDGNYCSSEDTVEIVVSDAPDASITPVDPFCIYNAAYDLESATPVGTWEGTGIVNANTGMFDPSVAGPGRHTISYTTEPDANGCVGTDTMEVAVADIPSARFLTPDSAWCEQENNQTTAEILITGSDSTTFDLIINKQGTIDTVTGLSNGIYEVQLDNQAGTNEYSLVKIIEHHGNNSCEQSLIDALVMQVNPNPVITLNADYDNLCSPVAVDFEVDEGYNKYTWDFGDGHKDEKNTNTISHTFTYDYTDNFFSIQEGDTIYDMSRNDTVFTIKVIAKSVFGCSDSLSRDIKVYPNPDADFFVSPSIQNYPDSVVYLYNLTSMGNWSYLWDFGDFTYSDQKEPDQHIYNSWGIFNVRLKSYSPFCADSATNIVQIFPPPPVAFFEPDTTGCPPLSITFNNTSDFADTYIWDFDDGKFSSEPNPTHTFYDSREYTVTLAVFGLSGTDTTQQTVLVYERPQAIFDAYPRESRNLKQNFKFINNSQYGSYYLWNFGDGTTSSKVSPNHVYEDSGTYTITLYVWNENDCADTLVEESFIRVIAGEGSIDFPTAFVWNGNGPSGGHWKEGEIDNTVFHPAVINAVKYRLVIYTRWGEQVFESNDLYVGWDGYLKSGNLATEGVYLWKVWVTYVDGLEEIKIGDITFLH